MFLYYYGYVPGEVAEVEATLLELVRDRPELGRIAYREAQELRADIGSGVRGLGKTVRLSVGEPIRGPGDTRIPMTWTATGAAGLFPRLDGEVVVSEVGPELAQILFRGSYDPPLGRVGEVFDKVLLHRLAEASVKRFVDGVIAAVSDQITRSAVERAGR